MRGELRVARRYKRKTGIGYITFIVLCICVVLFVAKINLEKDRKELENQETEIHALIKEQEDRANEIKSLEAYVQTKKHIEDIAREKLGLVYEDEILFQSND